MTLTRNGRTSILHGCAVLAALIACASCSKEQPVKAKGDTGPLPIRVAPVTTREVNRIITSVGTLFPYDETIVSAEIGGRIIEMKADLGDAVGKGQVLVRISDEEQRYIVAQNEAQLRMAMERVGLKDENDRVKDVRQASEVRRAEADLVEAEASYKRVRSLVDQGIGSRSELDTALARYRASQAAYDQSINGARNLLQDIERTRAALDLQRKKLRDTTVLAPFAGRVKERTVTQGQVVSPNTPLFTIVKVDPLRLRIEIPERMGPWVKAGQVAEVAVEAFENRKFRGVVWRVSPTVDQAKRTFIAEALVDNPIGELKPGSYARAILPTNKSEQIKLIPAKAIAYVFGSNKAYVVNNGVVEARDIKLGDRYQDEVEIIEGLEGGESVAITQLNRIDTGSKVRVATAPASTGPAPSAE